VTFSLTDDQPSLEYQSKKLDYIRLGERNTKIEIRPIRSYGGPFPSHLVRMVKLRVRISSVTDAAALRCG